MKRLVFCFASLSLVLLASTAFAQNGFLDVVGAQLVNAAVTFVDRGYEMTHDPYTGSLNHSGQKALDLMLDGRRNYAITAACDQDCRDLDLYLYDENGNLIVSDVENDDYPLVTVRPRWRGKFTLVVRMASCRNEPCYYGVGVFGD